LKTILVADDDAGLRAMLREALQLEGHRVVEAGSAIEIFQALDERRPDVILLDVHLGADDGIAIGVGLRRERQYKDVEILFMTGTLDQPELHRMSRMLKAQILAKPIDIADLSEALA
jgi:DNA-binding response OmpR family regulator